MSDDTLDDSYYGYRLYEGCKNENNDDVFEKIPSFVGLLEKPVRRKFENGMNQKLRRSSCHICTQPKNTNEKDLPRWLRERKRREHPTDATLHAKLDKMQDYDLREGMYSNKNMNEKFERMNGGRKFNQPMHFAKHVLQTKMASSRNVSRRTEINKKSLNHIRGLLREDMILPQQVIFPKKLCRAQKTNLDHSRIPQKFMNTGKWRALGKARQNWSRILTPTESPRRQRDELRAPFAELFRCLAQSSTRSMVGWSCRMLQEWCFLRTFRRFPQL